MRDIVVAGGGPVGLAAALYAARAGLDVVVREPRTGSVDKACGEGLMPAAVAALNVLGVEVSGHRLSGIRYVSGEHAVEARFRHGPGRGVRRTHLHDALRAAVDEAGIPVETTAVARVEHRAGHVDVDGVATRHLVAADGLHSPVRRLLGLDSPVHRRRRYGLRGHFAVAPWTDVVEVHWSRHAEAYVTPVAPDLVGVAVLSDRSAGRDSLAFPEVLERFPHLVARLDGALPSGRIRGAGPLRQRSRRRVDGRVLLVGDAAGYVDALTGEGIALGMAQAEAAVAAIAAGRHDRYEDEWRRLTRRHDLLTGTLLAASGVSPVRRLLVPAATWLPRVFEAAVNQVARPPGAA